jgi:hypothetical protein
LERPYFPADACAVLAKRDFRVPVPEIIVSQHLRKIDLTRGVYFVSIPEAEAKLISAGPEMMSMALSINDTKQIFRSMERAYDRRELEEIKLGDLSWKTDCRVRSNPEKVTISFKRGWERTRADARRQDLATAITSFSNLFGMK